MNGRVTTVNHSR